MLALAASGCAPVMHRDPATLFAARRAPIADVVVGRADTVHGHLVEPVRVRATNGLTVEMLVKRPIPASGSSARAPLVLLLGGHHAGREAANYIPDTQGYAVAALSYPYDGPHKLSALGALRAAPSIRRALLDTPPAIQLALDWLLTEPWVDARRVEGVGASLGVPFMTAAAAVDPRITRLWAVHGAGDLYELLAHNMRPLVRARPLRAAAVEVAYRVGAGDALAPERWIARISPRPFVMINATDDERIPRDAVLALYRAAREPKSLVWLPGRHVQRDRPEVTRALVAAVLERMGTAE
jgi:fermentation-respiration switch protein FrsA (DUF1100 family)